MATDIELFEKYWDEFIQIFRNKVKQSRAQPLTHPLLKLMLSEIQTSWNTNLEDNGRWLHAYTEKNPEKGKIIQKILLEDMHFDMEEKPKNYMGMVSGLAPFIGVAAGFGMVRLFHTAQLWKQIISLVTPAAVAYPTARKISDDISNRNELQWLEKYIFQLDKYKSSVISVLNSGNDFN